MPNEGPIGPNPCPECGGEYGEHLAWCSKIEGTACTNCGEMAGHLETCSKHPKWAQGKPTSYLFDHDGTLKLSGTSRVIPLVRGSTFSASGGESLARVEQPSASLHVINAPRTLEAAKKDALEVLETLRVAVEAGEIVAFAAVGIEVDDTTRAWACANGKTRLQLLGAISNLMLGFHVSHIQ